MLVETSSSGKITTSGNPYIFRISPPSSVEAAAFEPMVPKMGLKKVDFLVINNDWGRGAAEDFGKMLKADNVQVGLVETMDQAAQDMSAQLAKIKIVGLRHGDGHDGGRTADAGLEAGGRAWPEKADHHDRRLAEPRSADRSRRAPPQTARSTSRPLRRGSPTRRPTLRRQNISSTNGRSAALTFPECTESFRGYDGIRTIVGSDRKGREGRARSNPRRVLEYRRQGVERRHQIPEAGAGAARKAARACRTSI